MRHESACERFVKGWRGGGRLVNTREPRLDAERELPESSGMTAVGKPSGLWYGCGTAWLEWCLREEFGVNRYVLEIDVDESRILRLRSPAQIERFVRFYRDDSRALMVHGVGDIIRAVDWGRVRERWAGVEIDPYCPALSWTAVGHDFRSPIWYSGWDCSSGCLWDLSAVTGWRVAADFGRSKIIIGQRLCKRVG